MEFKYKAKVDKKWLKGRSLTDHKEDATEFETESEPTQIINKLKRDGKIPQKATIKIVKRRESAVDILGDIDAVKVRSCLTLFDAVSPDDIFQEVLDAFYGGTYDKKTLDFM